jgi:hypothetical protein
VEDIPGGVTPGEYAAKLDAEAEAATAAAAAAAAAVAGTVSPHTPVPVHAVNMGIYALVRSHGNCFHCCVSESVVPLCS